MKVETALANRLGNRERNEDRCSILERAGTYLLLLADGMGGHAGGNLASQQMIESITNQFRHVPLPVKDPRRFLRSLLEDSHRDIVNLGRRQDPPITPRTTSVLCLVQNGSAWWAHVGDSRLYLVRNGKIATRTTDHTFIEVMRRQGALDEAQIRVHPLRNHLTHCLGSPEEIPPVELSEETVLTENDVILICSDGLWGALDMDKVVSLFDTRSLADAVNTLAAMAERSSHPRSDNVSLVTLRLDPTDQDGNDQADSDQEQAEQHEQTELSDDQGNAQA